MTSSTSIFPFERITIVGVGLIGGSLALAIRQQFPKVQITGVDKPSVLKRALERNAIHLGTPSLRKAIPQAQLIVLATPVHHILEVLPTIAKLAHPKAIITDTGSVKGVIVERASKLFPNGNFIGGHPMTGAEFSGIDAAHPLLFQNALYILTPSTHKRNSSLQKLIHLCTALDARVLTMDPLEHDRAVAAVSHLPQLAAVALMNTVGAKHTVAKKHLALAAGGFRDMTRIASSKFDMWHDILETNKPHVREALLLYIDTLQKMSKELQQNPLALKKDFVQSRALRGGIPRSMKGYLSALVDISVYVNDTPGQLALLTSALANASINIKDIELIKVRERRGGTFRLSFENNDVAQKAKQILKSNGFEICE
jgi:prephenate dehydrogenase